MSEQYGLGFRILRAVRNGANDLESICTVLDIDFVEKRSDYLEFKYELATLVSLKLIKKVVKDEEKVTYEVTSYWESVQIALGISLEELSRVTSQSMIINPASFLGKPPKWMLDPIDLFVLMPFRKDLAQLELCITEAGRAVGLNVTRADRFFTQDPALSKVWQSINAASAMIVECSDRNPNVFYELGLAHAIGKPTVLIQQQGSTMPFDTRHLQYIKYDYTPRGMKLLERELAQAIKTVLNLDIDLNNRFDDDLDEQYDGLVVCRRERRDAVRDRSSAAGMECAARRRV